MPLVGALLLLRKRAVRAAAVNFRKQLRADGADLLVWISLLANFALAVQDGMDMQSRRLRSA
jgi:hypothetical protein